MLGRTRRRFLLAAAIGLIAAGGPAATASVAGPCTMELNGIQLDRIDQRASPLELDATETLVVTGTAEHGTSQAEIRLLIGPVILRDSAVEYLEPENEFRVLVPLEEVSPFGVGLLRAEVTIDGCRGDAWVRVSGRLPLATLAGLAGIGLALGGITGQLGAVSGRRKWMQSASIPSESTK